MISSVGLSVGCEALGQAGAAVAPWGVRRPLRGREEGGLLLSDERVLAFFLRLFVHPDNGALSFAVELGFHGALLRLIHRAHVI